jgi:hypothetical protein
MIRYLSMRGKELIDTAYATKETGVMYGNQNESYGWAVFHNGKRVRSRWLSKGPTAVHPYWWNGAWRQYGSNALQDAFMDLDAKLANRKGFDLAIINAVPYTYVQEYGRKHWRVITQVYTDLADVGAKLGAYKVSVIEPRHYKYYGNL